MVEYDLKEIVTCKHCRQKEYWGNMIWLDGTTYCRGCYYYIRENKSYHYTDEERVELCR